MSNPANEYTILAYEHRRYRTRANATIQKLEERAEELKARVEEEDFGNGAEYVRVGLKDGSEATLRRIKTRKYGQATPKRVVEYAHRVTSGEDLELAREIAESLARDHEERRAKYEEQVARARTREEVRHKREEESARRETRKRTRESEQRIKTQASRYAQRMRARVQESKA
jgi:hypothetical protein